MAAAYHAARRNSGASVAFSAGELAFQRGDRTHQIVTLMYLPLRQSRVLFGLNCVLKLYHLTLVFGDLAFNLRDVDQGRAGGPPTRIRLIRPNPLSDVLSMRFRSG